MTFSFVVQRVVRHPPVPPWRTDEGSIAVDTVQVWVRGTLETVDGVDEPAPPYRVTCFGKLQPGSMVPKRVESPLEETTGTLNGNVGQKCKLNAVGSGCVRILFWSSIPSYHVLACVLGTFVARFRFVRNRSVSVALPREPRHYATPPSPGGSVPDESALVFQ